MSEIQNLDNFQEVNLLKIKRLTYENNVILGIMCISSTNIQAIAVHFLNDSDMISAVKELINKNK